MTTTYNREQAKLARQDLKAARERLKALRSVAGPYQDRLAILKAQDAVTRLLRTAQACEAFVAERRAA